MMRLAEMKHEKKTIGKVRGLAMQRRRKERDITLSIRLIAIDMDGTVLRSDRTISQRTMDDLEKAIAQGIWVVPCTGRVHNNLPEPIQKLQGVHYVVSSNGANVADLDKDEVIYRDLLKMDKAVRILQELHRRGHARLIYFEGKSYMQQSDLDIVGKFEDKESEMMRFYRERQIFVENICAFVQQNGDVEKIFVPYLDQEQENSLWKWLEEHEDVTVTSSVKGNIEINEGTANKGSGLKWLCDRLDIDASEVMALGDQKNDEGMLRYAGYSVAMGNAVPEMKAVARYETDTNDNDGVAKAIERYAL